MKVSATDRDALLRQQAALATEEESEEVLGDVRDRAIAAANQWRRRHGIPPLTDEADRPELELHELARTRGLLRRIR